MAKPKKPDTEELDDLRDPTKGLPPEEPAEATPAPAAKPAPATAKGEKPYRITFVCANQKGFILDPVNAYNDLSIALACNAAAVMLAPRIMGYRIVGVDDGRVVADCGILDFIAAVTPKVSASIGQPILDILHLKEGQKLDDAVEEHVKRVGKQQEP